MHRRCKDPQTKDYSRYGGRGITVCQEWGRFEPFETWALAHGYQEHLLLDRRNNELGYSPSNCRFVTPTQQARNRRGNVRIAAFGETKTIAEWADDTRCSVPYPTLHARLTRQHVPAELAITAPHTPRGRGRQRGIVAVSSHSS